MDTDAGLIDRLMAAPSDTLASALVILAITATLAVLGRIAIWALQAAERIIDKRRRHREIMTDVLIYGRFTYVSVLRVTAPEAIAYVQSEIRKDPKGFRGYLARVSDDEVFTAYREIRRTLSAEVIGRCDTFFGQARLFDLYYEKTASKEFQELSEERKIQVIDRLAVIGTAACDSYVEMIDNVEELRGIARKIRLADLIPGPEDDAATPLARGQTIGGSGPLMEVRCSMVSR